MTTFAQGAAALIAATLAAGGAEAASPATVWQGDAFVTAVTAPCTPDNVVAPGNYYRVVYRPKLASTDPAEGLAFVGSRSDLLIVAASGSGMLQGSGTIHGVYITSHAGSGTSIGASQLTVSPLPIRAGTETVTISGTLTNFFAVTGCDITFRSALTLRP